MTALGDTFALLIPLAGMLGSFVFIVVYIWIRQKRKERESYYRFELSKHLADKGMGEEALMKLLETDKKSRWADRREGLKLSGLILLGIGVGLLIGLRFIEDADVWMVGWIPAALGAGLLVYGLFLAPKSDD